MKSEILQTLEMTRKSHLSWIIEADKLCKNFSRPDIKDPVQCTHCDFGLWYYKKGMKIYNLPALKRIQLLHEDFHVAYKAMYYKRFDRRTLAHGVKKFFTKEYTLYERRDIKKARKYLGSKYTLTVAPDASCEERFTNLKLIFDALYKEIQALEIIVSAMNEKLFDENRFEVA